MSKIQLQTFRLLMGHPVYCVCTFYIKIIIRTSIQEGSLTFAQQSCVTTCLQGEVELLYSHYSSSNFKTPKTEKELTFFSLYSLFDVFGY